MALLLPGRDRRPDARKLLDVLCAAHIFGIVRNRAGPAHKITLYLIAALAGQECKLIRRFHAFSDDGQIEAAPKSDYGSDDC